MTIDTDSIVLTIIANGEFFEDHWFDDGDGESGPMGGRVVGYRHDGWVLDSTPNGSVLLTRENGDDGHIIYNSSSGGAYTGIGHMVADHLHALKRNLERNGIVFVKTGRRPTEGRFALNAILDREATR